jgi:TonB family protein
VASRSTRSLDRMKRLAAACLLLAAGYASATEPLPVEPVPQFEPPAACPNASADLIARVNPGFPAKAMKSGQTGWVILDYDVVPDGSTSNVRVFASSPRGVFDKFAVAAVRQWRYRPNTGRNCRVEIDFKLKR